MDFGKIATLASNVAIIIASVVIVTTTVVSSYDKYRKRVLLETYLRKWRNANDFWEANGKNGDGPEYMFSTLHLTAALGMTEDEVVRASFESRKIKRSIFDDPKSDVGIRLLFQHQGGPAPKQR